VRSLAAQGVHLAVLPDLARNEPRGVSQDELLPLLQALSAETQIMLAVGMAERTPEGVYKTLTLLGSGEMLAQHRQTHFDAQERAAGFVAGDRVPPVVATSIGNIGLIASSEGLVPEVARGLKLSGAEILVWCAGDVPRLRVMARTRANEERAYVVSAGDTTSAGGGYVVDPTGGVIAETLAGRTMATSGDIHRMLARWNEMAPGTNPVRDRRPAAFQALFAAPARENADIRG
jgi:predicted amidohydrolase